MITTPSPALIVERVRHELRDVVGAEVTTERARSALRLADELLARYATTLVEPGPA